MNGWTELDRFLHTDPRDVGCGQAMELLHLYVELAASDANAAAHYPGIAAHLRVRTVQRRLRRAARRRARRNRLRLANQVTRAMGG
jgi:hypothetical protein